MAINAQSKRSPDSHYGEVYMVGNATNTVITTTGVPVKIAGTSNNGLSAGRFILGNNRITWDGDEPITIKAVYSCTARRIGSGGTDYSFCVAINGTIQMKTCMQIQLSGQERVAISPGLFTLNKGDYLEPYVQNDSNVNDVLVEEINFIVSSL